ncbi:MAG: S49 family peptidase, partial [Bacteroidales bacterium]|nr:S49 family peptidase [Bacteroidales bacterium]
MKKFWKMVLAVICGLIIMGILNLLIFSAIFGAMAGSGKKSTPSLPREGVLRIDMSAFTLAERTSTVNFNFSPLSSGQMLPKVGIRKAVNALAKAAEDPGVKYVFLKSDGASGSFALLEEFREALDAFRKSGKAIVAYTEMPTTGSYYMASVADKVYMLSGHGAESMFQGVGGQLIFLKDILDKLGVNVQLIRHGKYKSAGEMYIRSEASPENIEQNQAMISSIWKSISDKITSSREISAEALDDAINNMKLSTPESFQELSLIDGTLTQEEMKAKIAELA